MIGGSASGAGNVISGSLFSGIEVIAGAFDNFIEGNLIGTDPAGMTPIPNQTGIFLDASGNTVGGAMSGSGNVISGNTT